MCRDFFILFIYFLMLELRKWLRKKKKGKLEGLLKIKELYI